MKKTLSHHLFVIVCFFCLSSLNESYAQVRDYNVKNSFWSEINFTGMISKKFEYQLDFQYRRQSQQANYQTHPNMSNIFFQPYQTVFRPWIHYFIHAGGENRKLRFSISPIGLWNTYGEETPGGAQGSTNGSVPNPSLPAGTLVYYPEVRSCYQMTIFDKIGIVNITQRYRFEFRWVGLGHPSEPARDHLGFGSWGDGWPMLNNVAKYRLRYFVRIDVPLQGKTIDEKEFYLGAYDELWIGMGYKTAAANFLDQNRAYAALGYKLPHAMRVEVGYLNQIVPQNIVGTSHRNMDFNNVIHLFLFFDNFSAFFSKKTIAPPVENEGGF